MRFLILFLLAPFWGSAQISPSFLVKSNLNYILLESSGEGLFGFEKDGKYGYMDRNEKVVIPAIYTYENETLRTLPSFTKGHVRLKKDGKYGILDKTGKIVIPFEYDYLSIFPLLSNHVSFSRKESGKTLYGIVTMQNKSVLPAEYDQFIAEDNMIVFKQNGKYGLADPTGKKLIPAEFSSLTAFPAEGVLLAEKDGKYGIVDTKGNWLFEKPKSVYTLLGAGQGMIRCKVNGKYGFLDRKGNEVIITRYDDATDFTNIGLAKVGQKKTTSIYPSHYGYIDVQGKEIIPIKYESIGLFTNGLAIAKDPETNRFGFLDKTGKWVIKPVYLDGLSFDEFGGAWVKMTDAKYHYIDKTGKDYGTVDTTSYRNFSKDGYALIANIEYAYVLIDKTGKQLKNIEDCDGIYMFAEGIAGYKSKANSKYGFMDHEGNKIIPNEYDGFTGFTDGVAKVEKKADGKTKSGYIDSKGNIIAPVAYETAGAFRDGWGLVKKDSNYFFVDRKGAIKEPPQKYNDVYEFKSGFAVGKIKGAGNNPPVFFYINTQLKEEFSITCWQAYLFWENVAVVSRDNKTFELMNKKGEVFKTLTGIETLKFCSDGMLAVRENGKWGFINDKGDMIVKAKYDSCESFRYGYGRVKMGSKWGIVDKSGTEIIEPKYENILPGENGLFIFFDKYWGVMDKTSKVLVPPVYFTIIPFEKERAIARLGKLYTIIKSPLAK